MSTGLPDTATKSIEFGSRLGLYSSSQPHFGKHINPMFESHQRNCSIPMTIRAIFGATDDCHPLPAESAWGKDPHSD